MEYQPLEFNILVSPQIVKNDIGSLLKVKRARISMHYQRYSFHTEAL